MSVITLIASGSKVWLDSIDPGLVRKNRSLGISGATSNPIIVAEILRSGSFDAELRRLADRGLDDAAIAWQLTDQLVRQAQEVFRPVWETIQGNDGYVSFELDPLLEDAELAPPHPERIERYVELGKRWGPEAWESFDHGSRDRRGSGRARVAVRGRREPQRHAGLGAAVPGRARCNVARRAAAQEPRTLQERRQHLRVARGRLHGGARTRI